MKVTSLIASLIKLKPRISGYDIYKTLQNKTRHSHQQIYRELNILCKYGDIQSEKIPQEGRPDKILYRPKGAERLKEQVNMTNFRKQSVAYRILEDDLKNGTKNFDQYVELMEKTEKKLVKFFGVE
jgi:DNA-binding PadR family transcriptional regulator